VKVSSKARTGLAAGSALPIASCCGRGSDFLQQSVALPGGPHFWCPPLQHAIWAFSGVMAPAIHVAKADVTTPAMTMSATTAAARNRITAIVGARLLRVKRSWRTKGWLGAVHIESREGRRWYSIGMRFVALMLLVSLIGPPVAGAACDLNGLQRQRQSARTTAAGDCHAPDAAPDGPALTRAAALCHHGDGDVTAAISTPPRPPVAPAFIALPTALGFHGSVQPATECSDPAAGPPRRLQLSRQLRI
jgi:hypothetical protein